MQPQHSLFSFPFSCAMAVELVLTQQGVPYAVHAVDRGIGRKVAGGPISEVNPKHKVPTLVLPDGSVRTEIVSILHDLDLVHTPRDDAGRRAHLEWLCFLSSELHQAVIGPIFDPGTPEAATADAIARLLPPVLADLEATLSRRGRLVDDPAFAPAEAYLFWGLLLLRFRCADAVATPGITGFLEWMGEQALVQQIVGKEQGLWAAKAR